MSLHPHHSCLSVKGEEKDIESHKKLNFELVQDEIKCLKSLQLIEMNEERKAKESMKKRSKSRALKSLKEQITKSGKVNDKDNKEKIRIASGREQTMGWAKITAVFLRKQIYQVLEQNQNKKA